MKLQLSSGGQGTFVALSGDRVQLHCSLPSAPGTPLVAVTSEGTRYEVKVRTSRKLGDEPLVYWVEGRLMNATRQLRERLETELAARPRS
jgi:hypothetical protein